MDLNRDSRFKSMQQIRLTLFLGLLFCQISVFGQHSWYPGTYAYSALDASGAVKEYMIFVNESANPVQLELALVENTLDPNWSLAFCYPETCRNFDIAYDTTTVIMAADSGDFSVEVIPFGVAGHGLISYEVWERGNPGGWHDTLTWEFDVTVGIDDIAASFEHLAAARKRAAQP